MTPAAAGDPPDHVADEQPRSAGARQPEADLGRDLTDALGHLRTRNAAERPTPDRPVGQGLERSTAGQPNRYQPQIGPERRHLRTGDQCVPGQPHEHTDDQRDRGQGQQAQRQE